MLAEEGAGVGAEAVEKEKLEEVNRLHADQLKKELSEENMGNAMVFLLSVHNDTTTRERHC